MALTLHEGKMLLDKGKTREQSKSVAKNTRNQSKSKVFLELRDISIKSRSKQRSASHRKENSVQSMKSRKQSVSNSKKVQ